MILFGVKLRWGQPNLFSLPPRRLGMSSLTQKPGIKDRIPSVENLDKSQKSECAPGFAGTGSIILRMPQPFRVLPFLESAFLLAHHMTFCRALTQAEVLTN